MDRNSDTLFSHCSRCMKPIPPGAVCAIDTKNRRVLGPCCTLEVMVDDVGGGDPEKVLNSLGISIDSGSGDAASVCKLYLEEFERERSNDPTLFAGRGGRYLRLSVRQDVPKEFWRHTFSNHVAQAQPHWTVFCSDIWTAPDASVQPCEHPERGEAVMFHIEHWTRAMGVSWTVQTFRYDRHPETGAIVWQAPGRRDYLDDEQGRVSGRVMRWLADDYEPEHRPPLPLRT